MKIIDIIQFLESIAPPIYQESYDNSGLVVGDAQAEAKAALICLDVTEAILEEAERKGCNLVIAHHPIVFRGLKRLTGKNYVERVVIQAIKRDIAIYALHTNLDNMFFNGVNQKIAEKIGLLDCEILAPKSNDIKKLNVFVPSDKAEILRQGLFEIGVGDINQIPQRSFSSVGFKTENQVALAAIKLEISFSSFLTLKVEQILDNHGLNHFEIFSIDSKNKLIGAGLIGHLPKAMKAKTFLQQLKKSMKVNCIKHTALIKNTVQRVALCGGAGGFLLNDAIKEQADVFITSDYKYHEFFDADGKIIIADIGHFESEQFTADLIFDILSKKFSNFASHCAETITNPVLYI